MRVGWRAAVADDALRVCVCVEGDQARVWLLRELVCVRVAAQIKASLKAKNSNSTHCHCPPSHRHTITPPSPINHYPTTTTSADRMEFIPLADVAVKAVDGRLRSLGGASVYCFAAAAAVAVAVVVRF